MRCPTCGEPIDDGRLECAGGHRFAIERGVLCVLDRELKDRLDRFLPGFQRLREARGRRLHDPTLYPRLPHALMDDPEWRVRAYDLAVVRRLVAGIDPGTALDVGAWNGWLSHRLAGWGWRTTAVDYFTDAYDGLGAHRFYGSRWWPIQLDLRHLEVLDETFDLVVVNRCLQFSSDPIQAARSALARVAPGGTLVLTGLHFFKDAAVPAERVSRLFAELAAAGLEPFLPFKGFLDADDRRALAALGIQLTPYPQARMRLARLRGRLRPRLGEQLYGVLRP